MVEISWRGRLKDQTLESTQHLPSTRVFVGLIGPIQAEGVKLVLASASLASSIMLKTTLLIIARLLVALL